VRRAALALALLVGLAAAPGLAAAKAPADFYGIAYGTSLGGHDFKRMGRANVGSLRVQMSWPQIQPKRTGGFEWLGTDLVVTRAAQRHIAVLPTLGGTPGWDAKGCSGAGCAKHIRVASKSQRNHWKRFVTAAARRYGPNGKFWGIHPELPYEPIQRWEIWNEQNNPKQGNAARRYAKLLALADKAISSVDPNGKAIVGGMFGDPNGSRKSSAWGYLAALYRHGARKHIGGVALHPYSPTVAGLGKQIKRIRKVMRAHHDASPQVYLTELGWGSGKPKKGGRGRGNAFVVGPKGQKKRLANSFRLLTKHRRSWNVGGVYWYQWKDPKNPPSGLCAFCYSSGLYKANGKTAKPALKAYERFTR
jgi:hypothetical protein